MRKFPMWVDGKELITGQTYDLRLPYDGSTTATVAMGDSSTFEAACAAAERGAEEMAALSNAERSDLLLRAAALLDRESDALAELVMLESGKPIQEARTEVARGRQTLIASAVAARELAGEAIPVDGSPVGKGRMAMTIRQPLGIIGAITPFNFPLNLGLHKVGPALAGGNAVIQKPAELTPLSAIRMAQLFSEAGAPAGAYNVITGKSSVLGKRFVEDERIRMITFTGSARVGKEIHSTAGLKRVTLELGGNCGLIVHRDADLNDVVDRAVQGSFGHSGQTCISIQRIYVHTELAAGFLRRFADAAAAFRMGHPKDDATQMSSMISEAEAERIEEWIAEAVSQGAELVAGGKRNRAAVTPAILRNVPPSVRLSCAEAFGPVVVLNTFTDLADAIEAVNNTSYGLQAGIYTNNLGTAFEAARKIRTGGVMINDIPGFRADNMPYGGVKDSGLGREGPRYAIEEMTEPKLICWRA